MLTPLRRRRSGAAAAAANATSPAAALPDPAVLIAALPDPVIALDRAGLVRFVNPAAEQFLGASAAALRGHPLADTIAPHTPLFALVDAVWRGGGSIAEYDVLLEGPRIPARPVTIQGALAGEAG